MDSVITGKVWKFGDDINTDIISPAEYMDASYEVIGKHAMERAFPGFADAIARGDIIVAGKNFGSGSSRETAPMVIKGIGLPVVNFADTDMLNQGDEIRVDFLSGVIEDLTTGETYHGSRLPENVLAIVQDGGLKEHLKKSLKK